MPPKLNCVRPYSHSEIQAKLEKMKNGKGIGPNNILIEVWKALGMESVKLLTTLFQRISGEDTYGMTEKYPGADLQRERRYSALRQISWNKADEPYHEALGDGSGL